MHVAMHAWSMMLHEQRHRHYAYNLLQVTYKHVACAGKKLHDTLIDVENEGVAEVVHKSAS